MIVKFGRATFLAILFFGLTLKAAISLNDYSGYNKPPLYGDFEAQRHWQEITINIPIQNWYKNSSTNNLLYWGLDYPPLTAYHSYLMGKIAENLNSSYTSIITSQGHSSLKHKFFMRTSVLISDLLVYYSGIIFLFLISSKVLQNLHMKIFCFLIFVIFPGQSLIDNGHFQYNNMSLGLTLWAINCILINYNVTGSVFFALALNYKQMELYHAIPFFVYLLRKCFPNLQPRNFVKNLLNLSKISIAVILTFAIMWLPWLYSFENFKSVLLRIFPFERGVFEDKVSNVWCILNVIVKLKEISTNQTMAFTCLISTGIMLLPSTFMLWICPRKLKFLYALIISSLGFFLFSFQVHEKSILMAAFSALILLKEEPEMSFWFLQVTIFSIFPLLHKDGLLISFIATNLIFEAVFRLYFMVNLKEKYLLNACRNISLIGNVLLVFLFLFGHVPKRLPHLYSLLIAAYCCLHFFIFFIYFNIRMYNCYKLNKKQKKI